MTVDHFFAATGLDRLEDRRRDPSWVAERLADETTGVIPVWRGRSLVARADEDRYRAVVLRRDALSDLIDDALAGASVPPIFLGAEAPSAASPAAAERERALFALDVSALDAPERHEALNGHGDFIGLRRIGGLLDATDGGLMAYAKAMVHWHRHHLFCGACGSVTTVREGGHLRRCTSDACGRVHFPRTDPAVIVRVEHDDRCLLARQASWDPDRYSVVAGFVEPGEGLEQAVRREVHEETAVEVGRVRYHSSQPWPFPSSLMIGFVAEAEGHEIRIDPHELEDALWVTRREVRERTAEGSLVLPPSTSISRRLIDEWLGPMGAAGEPADS